MVLGGDAAKLGVGVMTETRLKASLDFLAGAKLLDPTKVDLASAFPTTFVKDLKVLP